MHKKIIRVLMAFAVLAVMVAMPSVSSASPELTHPTGTTAIVGSKIKATPVGASLSWLDTSGNTLMTCTSTSLTGELTKNNGTEVEAKITSALHGGTGAKVSTEPANECTSSFGNVSVTAVVSEKAPWCLRSTGGGTDNFALTGGGCPGGGAVKYILASTTSGECEFESTQAISGAFTTHSTGDAIFTVGSSGFKLIRGGFLCPASWKWSLSFTLETDTAVAEPFYIS